LFVFAESYLQDVMAALSQAAADARLPLPPALFHPDRWLLWLGLAFVLAVHFAPAGIVGLSPARRRRTNAANLCRASGLAGVPGPPYLAPNHHRKGERR
jgi:hypothetical protein